MSVVLTGKAHGEAAQEEGLARVLNHGAPDLGVQAVAEDADEEKGDKEDDVEAKDDVGNVLQPRRVVGQVVEEDRDDARAHVDGEPSIRSQLAFHGLLLSNHDRAVAVFGWFQLTTA